MSEAHHESIIPQPNYEKTPLRLTRRGKIALGAAAAIAGGLTVFGVAKAYDILYPDYGYSQKTVLEVADSGDTEWSIANHIDGVGDKIPTIEAVEYVRTLNPGLEDGLQAGEGVIRPKNVIVIDNNNHAG